MNSRATSYVLLICMTLLAFGVPVFFACQAPSNSLIVARSLFPEVRALAEIAMEDQSPARQAEIRLVLDAAEAGLSASDAGKVDARLIADLATAGLQRIDLSPGEKRAAEILIRHFVEVVTGVPASRPAR